MGIAHRPAAIGARQSFGRWGGDLLIFSREYGQANVTSLVEHKSRRRRGGGAGCTVIPNAATRTAGTERLQANVHVMLQRRTLAAVIMTRISAHSFRTTGITTYLQNGGKLEWRSKWQGTKARERPGFMIDATMT